MEAEQTTGLWERVRDRASAWRVTVERFAETERAILAFGCREGTPVVLKVIKRGGDECDSGRIIEAYAGRGVVRAYEYSPGALLMERLVPGRSLSAMALCGTDDEATRILSQIIKSMLPSTMPDGVPTAAEWGRGFDRFMKMSDSRIPWPLASRAHTLYTELCDSQREERLLHGDLHHNNVLLDAERGWLAIDPKGVIAELEYEVGASLRNPCERPELFAAPSVIRRRVERFAQDLNLDRDRIMSWAFAQAVLAAIWAVEDDSDTSSIGGWILLAERLSPLIEGLADS